MLTATIMIIVIMAIAPTISFAQNNKYKIDDKLYAIYVEAEKKQGSEEGLRLAKEMEKKAVEIGDKKAQCLARIIPMDYYMKKENQEMLTKAAENLKAISRKNGYLQYYYFAYTKLITYLQNRKQMLTAMEELDKMKKDATRDQYPYGISSYYRMLANIYWQRRDYVNAKKMYKQGLEYFKANVKGQDHSAFNLMLSRICIWESNYEEAMKYVEDGLKEAKNDANVTLLLMQKARLFYIMRKEEEFYKLMPKIEARVKAQEDKVADTYIYLKVYQYIMEDNAKKAEEWANKLKQEDDRILLLKQIAETQGDWENAYKYMSIINKAYIDRASDRQTEDIAELNVKFNNERLHSEMLEQKMKTDQLMHEREKANKEMQLMTLTNANMEMRQRSMSDSIDRAKLIIDKTRLTMNTKLANKQVEVEKAQSENLKSKYQAQRILFVAGFLVMFAIVTNLVWNKRKSKRFIKTLSDKNDELTIARDKAQQSEKMKTMFIQNVSHEIRTPLNAIVGFSNLLVDPNMETSQEEKQEFRDLISNNSELLTSLVNDVLTLSELQSGKAGLTIAPCKPNDICRIAIKTVEHRKPEGVDILFTTDASDNFSVNSDARRINQVLINFLTNAEKYTTNGSITVDCSLSANKDHVTFSVTDTGCGIPEDKQNLIFERFEKLDEFHQGMGLGLNICAMIANLLNAKIGIDNTYTNGARFYFAVPV